MDSIAQGERPEGLTSDYPIKTGFPAIWPEHRQKFAAL
jgi:site-specific DNA recombinase